MTTPVTPPASAMSCLNLEQQPGWEKQSGLSITGPGAVTPAAWDIVQTIPEPIQPPMTLDLVTVGVPGKWADWMAKAPPIKVPAGHRNCLIRASYSFDDVAGIQAFELGRRKTDENGVTDNGQVQLVPVNNRAQLECDIVPSAEGGWIDTGIRFPMFVAGQEYDEELYYINDANGACSLQYISLNGNVQVVAPKFQHIAGAKLGWDATVAAFQCDANPTARPFKARVRLSLWFW